MNEIYLDTAATTMPCDSILNAITPYIKYHWHNPSSLYQNGVNVRNAIDDVRNRIAELINAEPDEIYFTSGAAESNNWVIRGFDDVCGGCNTDIIITPIEHSSIMKAVKNRNLLSNIKFFDVDSDGIVDLDTLDNHGKGWTFLASIIAANNEIGTIQDLKKVSNAVHSNNGIFHTDATQLLPHVRIDVKEMGIDLMSASAQKLGGLKGTGFLYIKNDVKNKIAPLIYGEQESGCRGGTENVVGIIAMGEAVKHISYKDSYRISLIRDCFASKLESIGCKLVGSKEHRLPNNLSILLPEGVSAEGLLYILDMCGIMVSVGSACNSHSVEPSHVLKAIGMSDNEAARVMRITFSSDLTTEEMDKTVSEIDKAIKLMTID